jgi:hypothetical protein
MTSFKINFQKLDAEYALHQFKEEKRIKMEEEQRKNRIENWKQRYENLNDYWKKECQDEIDRREHERLQKEGQEKEKLFQYLQKENLPTDKINFTLCDFEPQAIYLRSYIQKIIIQAEECKE